MFFVALGSGAVACQQPGSTDEAAAGEVVETTSTDQSGQSDGAAGKEPSAESEQAFSACPRGEAPPCDPVLWMACYPRQAVGEHYCSVCEEDYGCRGADSTVESEVTRREKLEYFPCEEYGYALAALEAWHGKPVSDSAWQTYIESREWHEDVAEAPVSSAAQANFDELKEARERCEASSGVTAEDRAAAAAWFDVLEKTGAVPQAPVQYVDGQKATAEEFATFIKQLTEHISLEFNRRTPVSVDASGGKVFDSGPSYQRAITARPSASGMLSCTGSGEDCEGYEAITLYLDQDGNVVAQHVTAAACPFVYVAGDDGKWRKQGEILRHLNHASLEGTQSLSLGLSDKRSCDEAVKVLLSEEKDEITQLDAVWLRVGGRNIIPDACRENASAAFCKSDGRRHRMSKGDRLELSFSVPDDVTSCGGARLMASGYYEIVD